MAALVDGHELRAKLPFLSYYRDHARLQIKTYCSLAEVKNTLSFGGGMFESCSVHRLTHLPTAHCAITGTP